MPQLLPDLEVAVMPHGLGVQIRGAQRPYLIRGESASRAWAFLESHLPTCVDTDQLITQSPEPLRQSVRQLIQLLDRQGFLAETPVGPVSAPLCEVDRKQSLFWSRQGHFQTETDLATSHVTLLATGLFGAITYDLLSRSGVGKISVLASPDDAIVKETLSQSPIKSELIPVEQWSSIHETAIPWVQTSHLIISALRQPPHRLLSQINQLSLDQNRIWLQANEESGSYEIGPVVYPWRTACYTCLHLRRQSRDPFAVENAFYQEQKANPDQGPQGESLPGATMAASMVSLEAQRILIGDLPQLANSVLLVDWTLDPKRHTILRVPRCPDCYTGKQSYVPHRTLV